MAAASPTAVKLLLAFQFPTETQILRVFFFFFFLLLHVKKRRQQFGAAGGGILWAGHQAELPDNRINLRHFAADESLLLSSLLTPAEEGVGPCWKLLGDEPGLKGPGRPIPHWRITLWRLCIPHLNPPPRHDGDTVGGDSFIAKLTKCYDVNIFFQEARQ